MRFGKWLKILLGLLGAGFGVYSLVAARRKGRQAQGGGQGRRLEQGRGEVRPAAQVAGTGEQTPYQETALEVLRACGLQDRCAVTDVSDQVDAYRWCLFLNLDGVHCAVWGNEDATDRMERIMVKRKIRAELLRHVDL